MQVIYGNGQVIQVFQPNPLRGSFPCPEPGKKLRKITARVSGELLRRTIGIHTAGFSAIAPTAIRHQSVMAKFPGAEVIPLTQDSVTDNGAADTVAQRQVHKVLGGGPFSYFRHPRGVGVV